MAAEEASNLGLHCLRQQRSRAVAQHIGQQIGKRPWLGQLDEIILGHGVSLLRWRSGGVEHPHDTPPYPFTPSPTSAHNSPRSQGNMAVVRQCAATFIELVKKVAFLNEFDANATGRTRTSNQTVSDLRAHSYEWYALPG